MNRFCLLLLINDTEYVTEKQSTFEKCLENVKFLFDTYIVCVASNDRNNAHVIEKVKVVMEGHKKLGEVIEHQWKNYGYNKTYLFNYFRERSTVSDAKYIVWLDVGETFIKDMSNLTSDLAKVDTDILFALLETKKENIYMFPTLHDQIHLYESHIARNDQPYIWNFPVHERVVGGENNSTLHLNFFYTMPKKSEVLCRKNIGHLEEYLRVRASDSRCRFYLAFEYETFEKAKAIENYKKRIDLESFQTDEDIEERYISYLKLGRLCDKEYEKIYYFMQAYHTCPDRIESAYELMMHCHNNQNYQAACLFGNLANCNRDYKNGIFQEKKTRAQFDFFYALCLYYNGEYEKAYKFGNMAIDYVTKRPDVFGLKNQAQENVKFYTKSYEELKRKNN